MNSEQTQNETALNMPPPPKAVEKPQDNGKGDSSKNTKTNPKTPTIKQLEDEKTPWDKLIAENANKEPAQWSIDHFLNFSKYLASYKHLKNVSDIFKKLGLHFGVPKLGRDFVKYTEVLSFDGSCSTFGVNYSFEQLPFLTGVAATNFADANYQMPAIANRKLIDSNQTLQVLWDESVTQYLITAISLNRWDWIKNGVRAMRASPQGTIGDVTVLFTKAIDLLHGSVDTWSLGHWFHSNVTAAEATAYGNIHIINIADLVQTMNNTPNNVCNVKTPAYDLTSAVNDDNQLGKLVLLSPLDKIVVNLGEPVVANAVINGCPCRDVAAVAVNNQDADVGKILDNSLDSQTAQFALWNSMLHLPPNAWTSTRVWNAYLHRADLQDTVIRYYSRAEPELGVFNANPYHPISEVIWTYRVAKTVLLLMNFKQYGIHLGANPTTMSGVAQPSSVITVSSYGSWLPSDRGVLYADTSYHPVFIPWEFVNTQITNDHLLQLDGLNTNIVSGVTTGTIGKYNWPSSIRLSGVDSTATANYSYYIPNDTNAIAVTVGPNVYSRAIPAALPQYQSTTKVMSVTPSLRTSLNAFVSYSVNLDMNTYHTKITEPLVF